jgi:spore maturation protein CgeB
MLSGAVSVADKSEYMEQAFVSGAHYLGYDSSVSLPDLVATALEQDAYLEKIAMAGQTLAETQHRWENRAVDILKAVNQFLQQI